MVASPPSSGVIRQQECKCIHIQKQLIKLGKFMSAYDLLLQKCLWLVQMTLLVNFSCCWHGWVTFTPSSGRHHKHALDYCSGGEVRSLIIQQTCLGVLIVRFKQGLKLFHSQTTLACRHRESRPPQVIFTFLCPLYEHAVWKVLSSALWLCCSCS